MLHGEEWTCHKKYYLQLYRGDGKLWKQPNDSSILQVKDIPLSINFKGWYVDGSKVNTTTKDKTVTARITLSGGDPRQYEIRIRRDITWVPDSTVNSITFSYNGASVVMELFFIPPYATSEHGTRGYHVDLRKDGHTMWTMAGTYPPKLRVTIP